MSSPYLTFIIPIRHQDNAHDWGATKVHLKQTMRSIAAQTCDGWKCTIVANHGADLPDMPESFDVCRVDFAPNVLHEQGNVAQEDFYEAFRLDKGRRVLAGMLHSGATKFFMTVDDDDLVHRGLCAHVRDHAEANGWHFRDGYAWGEGGRLLIRHRGFDRLCGTSHIVRSDLILPDAPEDADDEYIKSMLGSHHQIRGAMKRRGAPLAPLPFPGAIYRMGHGNAHSKSSGMIKQFFMHKWLLKDPVELFRRASGLRIFDASIQADFFGGPW